MKRTTFAAASTILAVVALYLFYVNSMLFCYFFFRRRDTEPLVERGLFLLVGLVELVGLV